MIRPGLKQLEGLVEIEPGVARTHRYVLADYPLPGKGGWAKIPAGHLRRNKVFRRLDARSKVDLGALKLYLLLAAFRDVRTGETSLSYEKIDEYADFGRNAVSRAMSRLIELDLIRVNSGRDVFDVANKGYNRYRLLGLIERGVEPLPSEPEVQSD
jgi:hypothetical protein